ncbi:MAG: LTA synthase family protein [Chitinophagaceae bacterium]|nr:LTA synthase family protein [Chitinophagaceae bacterium]
MILPQKFQRLEKLSLQLLIVFLFFQVNKMLFVALNASYFSELSLSKTLQLFVFGWRFDWSAICTINLIFIILSLLPFSFVCHTVYQKGLSFIYILSNSLAFIFDLSDIGYFPFVRKRMTAEVFHLIGNKSDFIDLLPSYLSKFWYVSLAILSIIGFFIYLNKKINKKLKIIENQSFSVINIILFLVFSTVSILAIRGGIQLKPIQNNSVLLVANHDEAPIVLNTPFSIMHTLQEDKLKEIKSMPEAELFAYLNPFKNYGKGLKTKNCNVVMILLESFGKSYTALGGRKSFTPFLDSLMMQSLVFDNAYANAYRSADGIPACVASIPNFGNEPFATSPYAGNQIDALPGLLKDQGFTTSFFHGGTNGTMSFDVFCKNAGFQSYYGRTEYANDKDYDGTWGIWDEPFLQFVAQKLTAQKQPFFSTVFTLSSHEPFAIPTQYKNEPFAQLKGIQRGISYSDMALKRFFETVSKQAWFKNTLFVITADHNFLACQDSLNYYNQGIGLYAIPVIFYHPTDKSLLGTNSKVFQQIDLMPTILDYLKYPYTFFSLGKSAYDSLQKPFAATRMTGYQQFIQDQFILTSNDTTIQGVFQRQQDSLMHQNIMGNDSIKQQILPYYLAYNQWLINGLIQNRQSVNTFKK